ncbi:hypothetical protein D9M69_438090 [compost metagenome]
MLLLVLLQRHLAAEISLQQGRLDGLQLRHRVGRGEGFLHVLQAGDFHLGRGRGAGESGDLLAGLVVLGLPLLQGQLAGEVFLAQQLLLFAQGGHGRLILAGDIG